MGRKGRLLGGLGLVLAGALGACDYVAQKELQPGVSTTDDVRRLMGKPEMIWEEEDGTQVLEYVRGPAGRETYMVEIDAQGRFRSMKNVLVRETFGKVGPGMARDDVRRLLGKPTETARFPLGQEEVWSWRFAGDHAGADMFNVHFGLDGRVRTTSVTPARDSSNPP
ncbi:MAG TPA: hypothetical protein VN324_01140 [Quisquiliibacterium sp.]|jgi:outer membrane protein assembly factor BamE (lipoprotein component of BamABCDE complex)|nr:hypothetical protein [Quisquiliibacterium sp.]